MRSPVRLLFCAAVLIAPGCSPTPPMAQVEGVIKINGAPASNLRIQFAPSEDREGVKPVSSSAVSDAQGRYKLKCENGQSGAVLGNHKVVVTDNNLATEEEPGRKGAKPLPPNRVPRSYMGASTTPL